MQAARGRGRPASAAGPDRSAHRASDVIRATAPTSPASVVRDEMQAELLALRALVLRARAVLESLGLPSDDVVARAAAGMLVEALDGRLTAIVDRGFSPQDDRFLLDAEEELRRISHRYVGAG